MRKNKLAIIGICSGITVIAMVFSMINTALPAIQSSIHASLTQLQWMINIFGICTCSSLVLAGRLADIYGRRKLFLIGLGVDAIAMLGAGLANHPGQVIFFQALTGVANAIILAVSQAMLVNVYPANQRSRAIGVWSSVAGGALALGPVVSGFLVSVVSWRAIFFASLSIAILSFVLVLCYAAETKNQADAPALDIPGVFLLSVTIISFTLAVIEHQWSFSILVCLYAVSLLALCVLIVWERRVELPIVRFDLLSNRRFFLASFANAILIFFVWADFFLLPLFMRSEAQLSPLTVGIIMLFITVPLTLFSPMAGRLYQFISAKYLILVGCIMLLITACGQLYFTAQSSLVLFALMNVFFGIGWAFIWGPSTTAATELLSQERAGLAAGTFVTIQEIGGSVGLAITISVVRMSPHFSAGFHAGSGVLVIATMVAILATILMRKTNSGFRDI